MMWLGGSGGLSLSPWLHGRLLMAAAGPSGRPEKAKVFRVEYALPIFRIKDHCAGSATEVCSAAQRPGYALMDADVRGYMRLQMRLSRGC
jgi:hypothetical protein